MPCPLPRGCNRSRRSCGAWGALLERDAPSAGPPRNACPPAESPPPKAAAAHAGACPPSGQLPKVRRQLAAPQLGLLHAHDVDRGAVAAGAVEAGHQGSEAAAAAAAAVGREAVHVPGDQAQRPVARGGGGGGVRHGGAARAAPPACQRRAAEGAALRLLKGTSAVGQVTCGLCWAWEGASGRPRG
jgi:hypothetical protein